MHIRSLDGKLSSNSVFNEWSRNVVKAGILSGKTFEIAENMAGLVQEAGFVDVVERRFKWPVGAWSQDPKMKEIGRCNLVNWEQALRKWAHSSSAGGPSVSLPNTSSSLVLTLYSCLRLRSMNGLQSQYKL